METMINELLKAVGMDNEVKNEVKSAQQVAHVVVRKQLDTCLADKYVGMLAKVGNHFGMIDSVVVVPWGVSFGFVYSTASEWTGRLVDVKDIIPVDNAHDAFEATMSALGYFSAEVQSLTNRLARQLEQDKPQKAQMESTLAEFNSWLSKLGTEYDRCDKATIDRFNQALAEGK